MKIVWFLSVCFMSFLLAWCGKSIGGSGEIALSVSDFSIEYDSKIKLEKVYLNESDTVEVSELYQETWSNVWYKDSLLIAEKYDLWLWVNTFVQQNLDTLEAQWLTLENINKKQLLVNKKWNDIICVLVEYEITKWFISDVPVLYMSQLFVPWNDSIIMFSYMTESSSARWYASSMFKNVK